MKGADRLTLRRPDDWHCHLRDGQALGRTVADLEGQFGRVIAMPNLQPPIVDAAAALAYQRRVEAARPDGGRLKPLMTLYLTDRTTPQIITEAQAAGVVAAKLYPAGATTHSDQGVTDLGRIEGALTTMGAVEMPLLVHAEVTTAAVDIFDREERFLDTVLGPLVARHRELKVVVEHMTTEDAVAFVRTGGPNVAGTITAHHLLYNRNALFAGGLQPHYYCLPILKRERHRRALVDAATSGEPSFFLGTDSAPHGRDRKETACGCAGCYTGSIAMGLYAEAFEDAGALDRLEGFASDFGPDFYGLPRNTDTITLERGGWPVPESLAFGGDAVVPLRAGETVRWRVVREGPRMGG